MNFIYVQSIEKHLYEYYDGVPLIEIRTFNNTDFLLYVIDFDKTLDKYEYMLTVVDRNGYEELTLHGILPFLHGKLKANTLYHYTFGFWENSLTQDVIRLLTTDEAKEVFPLDDFILDFDYLA